jgi:hypothetical protein
MGDIGVRLLNAVNTYYFKDGAISGKNGKPAYFKGCEMAGLASAGVEAWRGSHKPPGRDVDLCVAKDVPNFKLRRSLPCSFL